MRKSVNKKIIIAALAAAMLMSGCAGAGVKTSDAAGADSNQNAAESTADAAKSVSADESSTADTADNNSENVDAEGSSSSDVLAVYESEMQRHYYFEEDGQADPDSKDYYDEGYKLTLINDKDAILTDRAEYPNNSVVTSEYTGTYTNENGKITFSYEPESGCYIIYIEGNEIAQVEYKYADDIHLEDIAGTYTCDSDKYGKLELNVSVDDISTIRNDKGDIYYGYISNYDDRWQLYAYPDESMREDCVYNWFLDFDGDKFTFEEYGVATYGKYAGKYTLTGDLGNVYLTVEENGDATANVVIDRQQIQLKGSIYINEEIGEISGAWLYNDDNYSMDIGIMDIGGGELNYSGTVTLPLSAG